MGFIERLIQRVQSGTTKKLAKVGVFTLAVTVVSYWVSFQDRISARQESAWATIRAAIVWTQQDYRHWGNVGQLAAIESLTRHCGAWWRGTSLQPLFEIVFPDCVNLNSLSLERMELGTLRAAGGNFSHSNFACANLATADFHRANLDGSDFRGAFLGGADLRGTSLLGSPSLRLANLSWIMLDDNTKIDAASLKCACVAANRGDDGKLYRQIQPNLPNRYTPILNQLPICPVGNTCEDDVQKNWKCLD